MNLTEEQLERMLKVIEQSRTPNYWWDFYRSLANLYKEDLTNTTLELNTIKKKWWYKLFKNW